MASDGRHGDSLAKPVRGLGDATALMAAGTLLSRFTGAIRSFVFLGFGATALADAYQIGNTTPNMLYELVAGGVLSATLVPIFVALTRKKTRRAQDGIDAIVTLVGVVLGVTVLLTMALAPVIMGIWLGSASEEKQQLAAYLLRWFAPQILFYGYITIATALLNAKRRFGAPMFAPVLNNLTVIIVLIWAQRLLANLKRAAKSDPNDSLAGLNLVLHDTPSKILLGLGTTMGVLINGARPRSFIARGPATGSVGTGSRVIRRSGNSSSCRRGPSVMSSRTWWPSSSSYGHRVAPTATTPCTHSRTARSSCSRTACLPYRS